MAISQAMCTSFKKELLEGKHNFLNTGGNTFKLALYTSSASLGAGTTAYTTSNEVSGTTGQLNVQFTTKRYPDANESTTKGPFIIQPNTEKVSMRARGRQAKIRVATSTTGTSWRYGTVRLDIGSDGMR